MFDRNLQVFCLALCFSSVAMLSPHPKLLLISFDGFRYDLLNGTMTPNIYRWAINSTWFKNGSKSQFVTYTAPNHMSIVTGLQEVKHGIVGNYFYDTTTGKLFDYFNLTGKEGVINASLDSSWYEGEPVWLTNEKSDSSRRSATFYWPHGDVHFRTSPHRPFFYKQWTTYGNLSQWMSDVDDIVDAFMSEEHPVNYVAWYVAEPDHTLHTNGFYNGELQKMLHELDELFGYLLAKFRETSLENSVNVILTADHGHAEIESVNNVMCIRDYVKLDSSKIGDHMIYADNEEIARELYHNLTNAVKTFGYKVDVYMKEDVPARYYYSNSTRIGDVVIVPQVGWAASLTCTSKELSETYAPRKARYNSSTHGMDPDRKEMRAVLVVGGPSIMSGRKVLEVPNNIDLYPFMCYLLSVPAAPNNSTLSIVRKALRLLDSRLTTRSLIVTEETSVFLEYHDSGTFMFLVMTTSFILMVFVIYACRYSILTEQPVWVWGQKGYRPLKTDLCSAEQGKHIGDSVSSMRKNNNTEGWSEESMSLLPKTTDEFTDPKFWKHFFETRKAPFEWYGDYSILGSVLEKYLRLGDTVLQIGCGNSRLAEEMYDNGFRSIHSIDVDSAVIEEQRLRNRKRPELLYAKDDATSLSFGDDLFSVVVDKGTLDSLLPPHATAQQTESVRKMFQEVERVLKEVGRYLVVTLAQRHIVKFWVDHFANTHRFLLRVHEVESRASNFSMPVFVLVATKLRNVANIPMPIEVFLQSSSRTERFNNPDDLLTFIISEQEMSQFVQLCSRRLDHEASIAIESRFECGPRYRFHIVDDIKTETIRSYAVFIVPVGRENEWMFSSEKGRSALRNQTGKDRLAVVTLSRTQNYSSLEEVKNELGPFAIRFDPRRNSGLIDFLSCGDVSARTPCASGNSSLNGEWVVEDVVSDGQEYRRLVFLSSSHIVQSEAYLKSGRGGMKTVDLDSLSCDHHSLMLAGLSIMPGNPLADPSSIPLRLAVLGLGGGVLASFLLHHFPKAYIDGIELDPDIVKVAVQWFDLPEKDPRMNINVIDALFYLEHAAQEKEREKLDVLFVDLAGPVHESGLSCPPAIFLTGPVLSNMKSSLKKDGIVALNMVTRDDEVALKARHSIGAHFPVLYHLRSEQDVNEVLFGCTTAVENFDPSKFSCSLRKDIHWIRKLATIVARITPVSLES